jgi:hypothetical protein
MDLIADFEALRVPANAFGHAKHIELAWTYLQLLPPAAARARFCAALQRFAASIGKQGLYREDLTFGWFDAIEARLGRARGSGFAAFAAASPELFDKSFLGYASSRNG